MKSNIVGISLVLICYQLVNEGSVTANRYGQGEVCPKMCACDVLEGLKRADCRLVSRAISKSDAIMNNFRGFLSILFG